MKTATIILLGSISCLVGCDSKTCSDGNASNPPARPGYFVSTNIVDIKENIRLMCDSLAKKGATAEFYGLASNFDNSLTSITEIGGGSVPAKLGEGWNVIGDKSLLG